jgi:hypothetical protein
VDAVARGEAAEKELDALIRRRHDVRIVEEGERAAGWMWAESERRYAAQRRKANRSAWAAYHRGAAQRHRRTLTDLVRFHEEAAEKLDVGGDAA